MHTAQHARAQRMLGRTRASVCSGGPTKRVAAAWATSCALGTTASKPIHTAMASSCDVHGRTNPTTTPARRETAKSRVRAVARK